LIELLVALVLLDIGLLALVALATSLTRAAAGGRATWVAASVASARVERLASSPCSGGVVRREAPTAAITESFSDTPGANGTRILEESVTVATSRTRQTAVLRTRSRC
jgi:Tfp pilus assembly protein PilV